MSLESNTLFHFTKNIENLKSILNEGFRVNYSKEYLNVLDTKKEEFAFPMVSFCDIPLLQTKNIATIYGKYCIGLTKKWGVSKNLNPVNYLLSNSFHSKTYFTVMLEFMQTSNLYDMENNGIDKNILTEVLISNLDYFSANSITFVKNYESQHNTKHYKKGYISYNEREWRYVPSGEDFFADGELGEILSPFTDFKNIKTENIKANKFKLTFQPADINYIIVAKEIERKEIILFIKNNYKNTSSDLIDNLISKILVYKQIEDDF